MIQTREHWKHDFNITCDFHATLFFPTCFEYINSKHRSLIQSIWLEAVLCCQIASRWKDCHYTFACVANTQTYRVRTHQQTWAYWHWNTVGTIMFTSTQLERLVNLSKVTGTKTCLCHIIPGSHLVITLQMSEDQRTLSSAMAHDNVSHNPGLWQKLTKFNKP